MRHSYSYIVVFKQKAQLHFVGFMMDSSEQLALYFAQQLPGLLTKNADSQFIGLKINIEAAAQTTHCALHAIYIEQQHAQQQLPFHALVTVAEWDGKSDEEEFFLEALTADKLIEQLQRFDEINRFVFFAIPESVTIDVVNMLPQAMFCKLFPQLLSMKNADVQQEQLKIASWQLLKNLELRLQKAT